MYWNIEIWNRKETLHKLWARLVFSLLWSYLVRVRALQEVSPITYLGDPTHSMWRVLPFPKHSYPSSFPFHLPLHHYFPLCSCVLFLFPFDPLHTNCILLCSFIFRKHHHLHHILCFFLLPLEVNLHTYLTTWLSSCPMGIFSRSHTLIVKIQIINKVSPLKWTSLKSTHITYTWLTSFIPS